MNRAMRHAVLLASCGAIAAALAAGCASTTRRQMDRTIDEGVRSETPESRREVHAELIRGMIESGQYYAAIAHVQAQVQQSGPTEQLQLFEAEARRRLGQTTEAQAIYRELLKSRDYQADAYYGLGLISARTDLRTGVWQLQQAVQRRPADPDMRNDLGYALILSRRYREALTELATAVELEGGRPDSKARNNLVLLMIVTGDEPAVQRLVRESGMSPETLSGLRRRAQSLAAPAQKTLPPGTKPSGARS
jgi:thioredoxin-like negative regulator of GroEL